MLCCQKIYWNTYTSSCEVNTPKSIRNNAAKLAGNLPSPEQVRKEFHQNAVSQISPQLMQLLGVSAGAGAVTTSLVQLARLRRDKKHRKLIKREETAPVRIIEKQASIADLVTAIPNDSARAPKDFAMFAPVAGATVVGGAMLGGKLTAATIRGIRNRIRQRELDKAKAEYEAALHSFATRKTSCELAESFDVLLDAIDKTGQHKLAYEDGGATRMFNRILGAYLLAAGGLAAYAGHQGASKAYGASRSKAIARANEERMIIDPKRAVPTTVAVVPKDDESLQPTKRKRKPIKGKQRTIA